MAPAIAETIAVHTGARAVMVSLSSSTGTLASMSREARPKAVRQTIAVSLSSQLSSIRVSPPIFYLSSFSSFIKFFLVCKVCLRRVCNSASRKWRP